ncbi:MAG: S8 family serine peptidase, partial [Patescibacteria group bacterium]|nr:S8 family serine peptidase [Patescibacteria group bacterium]
GLSSSSAERLGNINTAEEILVKFKGKDEIEVIKAEDEEDFYEVLNKYRNRPDVSYAEPNYLYHQVSLIPNDPYYNNQWYLQKIKAPIAWEKVNQSPKAVIAIIDSGIKIDHPDLAANIWRNIDETPDNGIDDDKNGFIDDVNGWDFINNVPDPSPKFEAGFTESGILHGTIVAGIAAAVGNNGKGITGVTWKTLIMPLRVLNDKGEGRTSEVVRAIDYAIANNADVINFSFVGFGYSKALAEAIKRAYDAGIIIVAAAGNEQEEGEGYSLDKTPMYPVCHDGGNGENMIIGVAATDTLDQKANFSSYGFNCVDIAAPGVSIFSTAVYEPAKGRFNEFYNGYWSGTSMATPMVSAAVALIEEANPKISRDEVVNTLLDNSDNISRLNPNFLGQLGKGRLNIAAAITKTIEELKKEKVKILVAPFSNYASQTKITDYNGEIEKEFLSYDKNFRGGINVAAGDVNGDGKDEIIAGAGVGGGPHIRVFDSSGKVLGQFFAYDKNFRGGVNVAAGDVNGDGVDEIIAGSGLGGGPQVRVFDGKGRIFSQFFAYDKNFRGGVNVATGDVNGDGKDEIVAGAGVGGGPQVRIFNSAGAMEGQFFAYNKNFRGGVRVAVADIDGGVAQKKDEIITAPGKGGGPHIRIFDNHANLVGQFFAYNKNFRGGVSVAAGDIDSDGLAEIITGAGPGGAPHVIAFEIDGKLVGSFYAYEDKFNGGVSVGTVAIRN